MWSDIERRAAMYGTPVSLPTLYPAKDSMFANVVAIVGMRQGWGVDFVKAAYRRWFQLGQETGNEPNLSESLREIGQEPLSVLAPWLGDQRNFAVIFSRKGRVTLEHHERTNSVLIERTF